MSYKLIPEDLPPKTSLVNTLIDDFMKMETRVVRVEMTSSRGRPVSYFTLRIALFRKGLNTKVKIRRRGKEIYLEKVD